MLPKKLPHTERLVKIIHKLRRECPWDRKQTHKSLMPYLVEEAFETVDAIQARSRNSLKEELGDLLLQILLHSELADEKGHFNFEDVAKDIGDKMIRRHPHVYGDVKYRNAKAHKKMWAELKSQEKKKSGPSSVLDGVPRSLPALSLGQKVGTRAARVGFDWKSAEEVFEKVEEEVAELKKALKRKKRSEMEDEMGDLFFALTSFARHTKIDAEGAARKGVGKFIRRFLKVETEYRRKGASMSESTPEELEKAWGRAKGPRSRSR